jgi:integrase
MKGSIRQRNKAWQLQIYVPGPDGKPKRHYETVRGRKSDAQRRLRELLSSLDKGVSIPVGRLTVAEHLRNWLSGYVRTKCSSRTLEGYTSIAEKHLIPSLGGVQLKNLTSQQIQSYYGKLLEGKSLEKPLSARTVHHFHRVLSQALKYAIRQGYLGRNPCELTDPPKPKKRQMRTLERSEVEVLLETAKDSYYYPIYYAAVSTGLRQAELLGLRWRDIDLDMCSISVSQVLYKRGGVCTFKEPKSDHSRRSVAMTPKLALFLRDYRAEREAFYKQQKRELGLDELVFASETGTAIDPCVLSHAFGRIVKKAGLERVRFHDLRHTFSSLMLLKNVSPRVVSEALGHSSVAFTLDTYSHLLQGMQKSAFDLLDEVLPAGVSRKNNVKLTADS